MCKSKKMLLITKEFPPDIGGAGMVAENISTLLSAKSEVNLLTTQKPIKEYNFKVHLCRNVPKIFPFLMYKKFKEIYENDMDSIIINDIGAALMASIFLPKDILRKCVVFLHGSEEQYIILSPSFLFRVVNFRKKYLYLLNHSKRIIAVSKYMKDSFLAKNNKLKDKVSVVYNSIDLNIFRPISYNLRGFLNIKEDQLILLSVSRVVKDKGYLDKYNIFKKLIRNGYKYHWIIIGEGDYIKVLKKLAEKDGLLRYIHFLGAIVRSELPYYYSSADAFWLLSHGESLGLVYIESIACNTKVIGPNNYGIQEIIINGVNGYRVNSNDECYEILSNISNYNLSREDIRYTVDKFDNNNIRNILVQNIW